MFSSCNNNKAVVESVIASPAHDAFAPLIVRKKVSRRNNKLGSFGTRVLNFVRNPLASCLSGSSIAIDNVDESLTAAIVGTDASVILDGGKFGAGSVASSDETEQTSTVSSFGDDSECSVSISGSDDGDLSVAVSEDDEETEGPIITTTITTTTCTDIVVYQPPARYVVAQYYPLYRSIAAPDAQVTCTDIVVYRSPIVVQSVQSVVAEPVLSALKSGKFVAMSETSVAAPVAKLAETCTDIVVYSPIKFVLKVDSSVAAPVAPVANPEPVEKVVLKVEAAVVVAKPAAKKAPVKAVVTVNDFFTKSKKGGKGRGKCMTKLHDAQDGCQGPSARRHRTS